MRILVTGSSGYVGSRLATLLRRQGHQVVGIDRRPLPGDTPPHEFVQADLLEKGALERIFASEVDCVAHLAAAKDDWGISAREYFLHNTEATRRLLEAGRRAAIDRWVFFSTVGVMGSTFVPLNEAAPFAPETPYGASKAEAERLFREFSMEEPSKEITIVRPSVVFGPGHPPNTNVFRLIEAIRRRRFLMIGDGRTLKATSYIGNLLGATLFLMDRMSPGLHTYIYVDVPVPTTGDLVDEIHSLLGRKRSSLYLPLGLVRPVAAVLEAAGRTLKVDFPTTAARLEKFSTSTNFDPSAILQLGFRPSHTLQQALRETVAWHLSRERS